MAKRSKAGGGPSIGLILTLIFFVLATFITGTVAYFGYDEVEAQKQKAAKAEKDLKVVDQNFHEERVRKLMLRIAMDTADDDDRYILVTELENLRPTIKDEYERMKRKLEETKKIPEVFDDKDKRSKSAFYWPLIAMTSAELKDFTTDKDKDAIKADPATRPLRTLPQMIGDSDAAKIDSDKKALAAETRAADAEKQRDTARAEKTDVEKTYNANIDKLQKESKDKHDLADKNFTALVGIHAKDGKAAAAKIAEQGATAIVTADQIAKIEDEIKRMKELLDKYKASAAANDRSPSSGIDFITIEEKKGEIVRKEEGGFVTINVGSSKKLRPQVTFLVVSADVSWLALIEKEESLKKNALGNNRQQFEDNPYVKAGVEVVEVLGPNSSRAKIIFENEPIRNPVQVRDQIFNLAWQPAEEIRIAFAGIIDLDGDGLDNNDEFLRILERQGVVVDEYLKLKPLEFVKRDGRGMSLQTKFLVLAPDPRLDAVPTGGAESLQNKQIMNAQKEMSDIRARAKALGVQVIEARKFLAMIGYKLPRNPAPPQYGSSTYFELPGQQPMMPPDSKKDGN